MGKHYEFKPGVTNPNLEPGQHPADPDPAPNFESTPAGI